MSTRTLCIVGVALLVALMLVAGCTPKTTDMDSAAPSADSGVTPEPSGTPAVAEPTDADTATEASAADAPAVGDEGAEAMSMAERMVKNLDTNHDGQLSKDEIPGEMWDHVAAKDTDGDGVLTADEMADLGEPAAISGHGGGMGGEMGGKAHPDMGAMQSAHGPAASDDEAKPTDE